MINPNSEQYQPMAPAQRIALFAEQLIKLQMDIDKVDVRSKYIAEKDIQLKAIFEEMSRAMNNNALGTFAEADKNASKMLDSLTLALLSPSDMPLRDKTKTLFLQSKNQEGSYKTEDEWKVLEKILDNPSDDMIKKRLESSLEFVKNWCEDDTSITHITDPILIIKANQNAKPQLCQYNKKYETNNEIKWQDMPMLKNAMNAFYSDLKKDIANYEGELDSSIKSFAEKLPASDDPITRQKSETKNSPLPQDNTPYTAQFWLTLFVSASFGAIGGALAPSGGMLPGNGGSFGPSSSSSSSSSTNNPQNPSDQAPNKISHEISHGGSICISLILSGLASLVASIIAISITGLNCDNISPSSNATPAITTEGHAFIGLVGSGVGLAFYIACNLKRQHSLALGGMFTGAAVAVFTAKLIEGFTKPMTRIDGSYQDYSFTAESAGYIGGLMLAGAVLGYFLTLAMNRVAKNDGQNASPVLFKSDGNNTVTASTSPLLAKI